MKEKLSVMKDKFNENKGRLYAAAGTAVVAVGGLTQVASAEGGTSLLDAGVTSTITGIAGQMVPTVLGLIAIIVPVGLSLWGIGFGVKKGITYLQSRAKQAI